MKKAIIFILSLVTVFGACTKVDMEFERNQNGTNEIIFNTNGDATTKAIVNGTSMVDNFGVYGYLFPGDYTGEGGYLMKNAEYEETGVAAGGKHYYWPKSDNNGEGVEFLFTAYSQYVGEPVWANDTLRVSVPAVTQEVIASGDFNDILWAQTKVSHHQDALGEDEKVILNFNHALSWVQFNAEVANNASVKWVKIKSVKFEMYQEGHDEVPAHPGQEYIAPHNDTTDTWLNLKKNYSAVASSTKLKGPGETTYTNAAALPEELVTEIKSYYSIDNGDAGDYDLHMGNTVWASSVVKQLRVVKEIPENYKMTVDIHGDGIYMDFFDGFKYLSDNGYDIQPGNTGGKPGVWDYVLIDAFVNGAAYTIVGFNYGDSNSIPNYTIVENPGQEYIAPTEYQPAVPAGYVVDGVYSGGVLAIPTNSLYNTTPAAVYNGEKSTDLNYCSAELTLNTNESGVLGNALIIPQSVPEYVTVVFDICIGNETGDDVVIENRRISRKINSGKDNLNVDYVASWLASNKYIYNFKFDGDSIDFTATVTGWSVDETHNYHVWDYSD